jgi:four helix bundle protein
MKIYNLEDRTLQFSKDSILLCKKLPKNIINSPLIAQVVRSSTSIGANYREANDGLGKKDFILRLRIARKEAKETSYWFELLAEANPLVNFSVLIKECLELRNILSSIIAKSL